jgi:hypothetical protein
VWWMGETKEVTGAQRAFRRTYAILREIVEWLPRSLPYVAQFWRMRTYMCAQYSTYHKQDVQSFSSVWRIVDFHNKILLKLSNSSSNTLYLYERSEVFTAMKIKSCGIESRLHGVTTEKNNLVLMSSALLNARHWKTRTSSMAKQWTDHPPRRPTACLRSWQRRDMSLGVTNEIT